MKLFGGKKGRASSARSKKSKIAAKRQDVSGGQERDLPQAQASASKSKTKRPKKKGRLSGLQKGLIILGALIAGLVLMVVALWHFFVQPPEISKPLSVYTEQPDKSQGEATPRPSSTTYPTRNPHTGEDEVYKEEYDANGRRKDFYTVLMMGTDDDGVRTDTIMLAAFDVLNSKLKVLSIPRDTIINVKWYPYKINSAYQVGGMQEDGIDSLKGEVESILGIPIDCYALIDLDFFVDVIDIIGGVPFDVPQRMYYYDPTQNLEINLYAGEQILSGKGAMELVRYRGYAMGDLQRVAVQQDFVKALAKQCLKIGNITKVNELAETLSKNLLTDLSIRNLAYFGRALLNVKVEEIEMFTLPGEYKTWKGLSYYTLYGKDVVEMINEHFNPMAWDVGIDDVDIVTISGGVMVKSTGSGPVYVPNTGGSSAVVSTPSPKPAATTSPDLDDEDDEDEEDTIEVPRDDDMDSGESSPSPSPSPSASQAQPSPLQSAQVSRPPTVTGSPAASLPPSDPPLESSSPEPTASPKPTPTPTPTPTSAPAPTPAPTPSTGEVVVPTDPPIS